MPLRTVIVALLLGLALAPAAEARSCPGPVITATSGGLLYKADRVEALEGTGCATARRVLRTALRRVAAESHPDSCTHLGSGGSCALTVAGRTWLCSYQLPRTSRKGRCVTLQGEGRVRWRVRDRPIA